MLGDDGTERWKLPDLMTLNGGIGGKRGREGSVT